MLSCDWVIGADNTWPSVELYQTIFERIITSYQLTNLALLDGSLSNGAVILNTQTSTLVELHVLFCLVANAASGFCVNSLPHIKRLKLRSLDDSPGGPVGDGQVLQFRTIFPSLETLYMDTGDLCQFGGEELGNALQIASTSPRLKHLTLVTSPHFKALPRALPITFNHLQTLVLLSDLFGEDHLRLVASVKWPSLTSLAYWCDGVYPTVFSRFLEHAPRLERLVAAIGSDSDFLHDLAAMSGQKVRPHLQSLCICNVDWDRDGAPPAQIPAMQKACPNATIHVTLKKEDAYNSRLLYGVHLSPQCGWGCYRCILKSPYSLNS
jgi:hypothetical protein